MLKDYGMAGNLVVHGDGFSKTCFYLFFPVFFFVRTSGAISINNRLTSIKYSFNINSASHQSVEFAVEALKVFA